MTTSRPSLRRVLGAPAVAVAVAVSVLAVGLGACGTGDGDRGGRDGASRDDSAGDRTTIELLAFGTPEELEAYRDVADAFEEENPDVAVRLAAAADRSDLATRLSTGFATGEPPDLFLTNYRTYGQYAARGALEPVQDRLDASEVLAEEDLYEEALAAFRQDGELVCLPQNISSLVVYFNEDLFADAGVAPPEAGWTWDDMVAAANELTVEDEDGDGQKERHGLGVEPSFIRLAPFVWSNGGEIFDDDERPTRITMDDPASLRALSDFMDLWWVHDVVPSELEYESEDNESRFANGRMAMVMGSRRSVPFFRTITDFSWDVAPLPIHDEAATILHSDAYCIPADAEHADEAWRFVEFAVGPQGAPTVARSGRTVPSLESVADSEDFLDPSQPPASSQVFLDAIPDIRNTPTISTWPEIEDAADLILEVALWRERKSPEAVVRELDEGTRDAFSRAEG